MSVPFAYLAVVMIWTTTPLAIKWSGEGPGFLLGVTGRMTLAAVICLLVVLVMRVRFPWHGAARRAYLSGAVGAFGSMLCAYWAAQHVPSGLIAVLFGLTPPVTALIAWPLLGERDFTPARLTGMLVGLAGLAVIFAASLSLGPHAMQGIAVLLLGVVFHALSTVLVKRHGEGASSFAVTTGALVIVAPLFFLTWLIFDHHWPTVIPAQAILSTVYLGLVGSVVGFTLYFYVVKQVPASTSALIPLITPVMALLVGAALNHEVVSARVWAGTALVLGGLALHQWGEPALSWINGRLPAGKQK